MSIALNGDGIISGVSSIMVGAGASVFSPAANTLAFGTNDSERVRIDSSGRLAIGTIVPAGVLHVKTSTDYNVIAQTSGSSLRLNYLNDAASANVSATYRATDFAWQKGDGGEVARIDSSGRLLIGTSSARNFNTGADGAQVQLEGTGFSSSNLSVVRSSADAGSPAVTIGKTRASSIGGFTAVNDGDGVGNIYFEAADGAKMLRAASISAVVDGTPGTNDMPGRLVFATTADGAGSPTERVRIISSGFFKASNTGSYQGTTGTYHEFRTDLDDQCLYLHGSNASWNNHLILGRATQSANSSYKFILFQSGNGGDTEFNLRGDGNAYADGSWNGGGADYAEYFEWYDANPEVEDRRGISVVLDGNKIREAQEGEDPIGVISGNPSVVGDAAWNKWSGKYLRDEYGTYIQEDYEVTDDDGNTVIQQRRKLNPEYDPDVEYVSREDRPEWDCVGLMGKLRIRKGQITGSRWIKMRDISDTVEEWLVR